MEFPGGSYQLAPHSHRNLLGGARGGPREIVIELPHHFLLEFGVHVCKPTEIVRGDVLPKLGEARNGAGVNQG